MKAYGAFTRKEFLEAFRTYKILILGIIFFVFGMMSPLAAKFLPELVENFMPEGMAMTVPEPTAMDAWSQFFKNISQIGLFVIAILFSGLMASEYAKGTLTNMLTKGLSRHTVVFSKLTMAVLLWTGAYALCFGVSLIYTIYFWGGHVIIGSLWAAVFGLWLFGVFLIALTVFGSILLRTGYGSLLFTGLGVVAAFLLNLLPKIQRFNPFTLIGDYMGMLNGNIGFADLTSSIFVTIGIIILLTAASCVVFNRKQL